LAGVDWVCVDWVCVALVWLVLAAGACVDLVLAANAGAARTEAASRAAEIVLNMVVLLFFGDL
jgi:hypothetical protein